ncbi:MAG TPA: hypothetical protein VKP30_05475 [Polyangiaceae bacterium]|nr:hypothetical protein [Polyangiaceae bacterium]
MGVITDFFLASRSDVTRVLRGWRLPPLTNQESARVPPLALGSADPQANPAPPIDSLPNVQCNGMLPERLALVFASLAEVDPDRALDLILLEYLTGPPESEVTVQRLPAAFVNALANARERDLERAAKVLEDDDVDRWGDALLGTANELSKILMRIQNLARQGLSTQADLFVWTCT